MDVDARSAGTSAVAGHVPPLSFEHSNRYVSTPALAAGTTASSTPPFRAWTVGLPGGAGRPSGVTELDAGVHSPCPDGPIAATSHSYSVPFVSPETVAVGSRDTPSADSIHSPSPARQRAAKSRIGFS